MSKVTPCLWFESQAEEAARFYASLLPDSAVTRVQRLPGDGPDAPALVVEFTLGGRPFLALNGGMRFEHSPAVSFSIDCEDQAEVDRLWAMLGEGGTYDRCGWLRDRYGVPWQVVPRALPRLLADPDPGRAGRVMQAMMGMEKLDVAALEAAAATPNW